MKLETKEVVVDILTRAAIVAGFALPYLLGYLDGKSEQPKPPTIQERFLAMDEQQRVDFITWAHGSERLERWMAEDWCRRGQEERNQCWRAVP